MDDTKDIRQQVFSQILDSVVNTNPFNRNRSGERAYRRAERLVAAIFLLTNHISSTEPLRSQARTVATSILWEVLAVRDEMRSTASTKVTDLQASVRHLMSLVKMMVFGGFVSTQNAEVIIAALDELTTFIHVSGRSSLSDSLQFSKDDFVDVRDDYKGHIKDIRDKRDIKDKTAVKDISDTKLRQIASSEATTSARSNGIVSILKTGGELNIRDIAAHLPEYSEKTIQRELAGMIQQGIIKRTGLKRWSRYSLTI